MRNKALLTPVTKEHEPEYFAGVKSLSDAELTDFNGQAASHLVYLHPWTDFSIQLKISS
jgi:hypothetical protein